MHLLKYTLPNGTTTVLASHGKGTLDDLIARRDRDMAQAELVTQSARPPVTDEEPLNLPTMNHGAEPPLPRPTASGAERQVVADHEPLRIPTMNFDTVQPPSRPTVATTRQHTAHDDEPLRLPTLDFGNDAGGR